MNCLAGVQGLFAVGNSHLPCTKGVDISTHISDLSTLRTCVEDYNQPKTGSPQEYGRDEGDSAILWVDCEGQGDREASYDTTLAIPILITSRVIIFNHKGGVVVSKILEQLSVLARSGDYIESSDEEDRPTKFGHLHIVLRDFFYSETEEQVYAQIMDKEQVRRRLKPGIGVDPAVAAKERNDVRDLLLESFETIQVWLLKQPALPDQLRTHQELPEDRVDPEFVQQVKKILARVTKQLNGKKIQASKDNFTSGPGIADIISRACKQMNTEGCVRVLAPVEGMEREYASKIKQECQDRCLAAMATLIHSRLPLSGEVLTASANSCLQAELNHYDNALKHVLSSAEEDRANFRNQMIEACNQRIKELLTINNDVLIRWVNDVVDRELKIWRIKFSEVLSLFKPAATSSGDSTAENLIIDHQTSEVGRENGKASLSGAAVLFTVDDLQSIFDELKADALERIIAALEELPGVSSMKETRYALCRGEEKMLELLSLHTARSQFQATLESEARWREWVERTRRNLFDKTSEVEMLSKLEALNRENEEFANRIPDSLEKPGKRKTLFGFSFRKKIIK